MFVLNSPVRNTSRFFSIAAALPTLVFATAEAQQTAPQSPPAWQRGRPPAMADSKLPPHAGKMTETAPGEIPLDKIKLPKGFMDAKENTFWGRPVDVLQMPDGALLVSDEQSGAIYRVTYTAPPKKKS